MTYLAFKYEVFKSNSTCTAIDSNTGLQNFRQTVENRSSYFVFDLEQLSNGSFSLNTWDE